MTTEATEGTEDTELSCKRVVRGGPEEAGDKERGATTDEGL
jgi:hypothetical protein